MRGSEVSLIRVPPSERKLFVRAKIKEIDSFIKNEAKPAYDSNRIVLARWVLTWKLVPPEEQVKACQDSRTNASTVHTRDGKSPESFCWALSVQVFWILPSRRRVLFNRLQEGTCSTPWRLRSNGRWKAWTWQQPAFPADSTDRGGPSKALGLDEQAVMRVLRSIHGSTTAPRGLGLDLHKTRDVVGFGCHAAVLTKDTPRLVEHGRSCG